jgi:hypothetical protein
MAKTLAERIEELEAACRKAGVLENVGHLPDPYYYAVGLGAALGIEPHMALALDLPLDLAKELSSGRIDQSSREA